MLISENKYQKTLEAFNLELDYLTFNIHSQDLDEIKRAATYLAKYFQCKTWLINQKTQKKILLGKVSRPLCVAEFRQEEVKYWKGTALKFKGNHARKFYQLFGSQQLTNHMNHIFETNFMSLGRIDVKYDHIITKDDSSVRIFLKDSFDRQTKHRMAILNLETQTLKIWKRKNSPKHYRIYLRPNGSVLRFELELKREKVKPFQPAFFRQDLKEFEEYLIFVFFQETNRIFDINHPYLKWLKLNFRMVRKPTFSGSNSLLTSYITPTLVYQNLEILQFYQFVQLLNFIRCMDYESAVLAYGEAPYRSYKFPVHDFLEFLGYQKTNYYQMKQLINFFESLRQVPPYVQYFSDEEFRMIATFPVSLVKKIGNTNYAIVTVYETLVFYFYPIHLPKCFLIYKGKDQLRAQIFLMQTLAQEDLQKRLLTEEFFLQLSLNKSSYSKVKNHLVQLFQAIQDSNIIKPEFRVTTKAGSLHIVEKLTSNLISRSKWIDFDENIGL